MTIEEAIKRLKIVRKREIKVREEKNMLRDFLFSKGVDLDGVEARKKRNKEIYKKYLKGISFKEIAETSGITAERCRSVAMREEVVARKKADRKAPKNKNP